MINENDIIKGKCIDLNHEGLGVVKIDSFPIFVFDLLVDEIADILITKVHKNYGLGVVKKRYEVSKSRVKPICDLFGVCGGCDLMHMSYPLQLQFKKQMINQTFKRIGHLDFAIKEVIQAKSVYEYRNKVQIPYRFNGKKTVCGFFKKKSHELVELKHCHLQTELTTDISLFVRNILNEYKIKPYDEANYTGVFRHLLVRKTYDDLYMVVLICRENSFYGLKEICDKLVNRYPQIKSIILNHNKSKNNTILGTNYSVLYGPDYLEENILGLTFKMSHKSFFQVNHEQTEVLYEKILEFADVNEKSKVLDCYCGVGSISLLFAKYVDTVYGIEIVEEAIENANQNKLLNKNKLKAKNIKFIVGKAEEEIQNVIKLEKFDLLVCDPPRKGLDEKMIEAIIDSNIPKVIYVSCDPATLARDLALLNNHYNIVKGVAVDLFAQTSNVESVCLLQRK